MTLPISESKSHGPNVFETNCRNERIRVAERSIIGKKLSCYYCWISSTQQRRARVPALMYLRLTAEMRELLLPSEDIIGKSSAVIIARFLQHSKGGTLYPGNMWREKINECVGRDCFCI
ncbi:hypothetical protein CEXT_293581 [Caerostris extrusa]|uniref:Uncharacterized protein n=1 Tax=Caerostris extrusa TaxID=172846 RepID=A0AAV4MU60_CAEEX|nr:hypothetical protein CEXT_293581 [Caerostris extrusa]